MVRGKVKYYLADIVKIWDCNTIVLDVNVFNISVRISAKMEGVKLPNKRSKHEEERKAAKMCIREMLSHIKVGGKYLCYIRGKKRHSVEIILDYNTEYTLNEHLLNEGYGLKHLYDFGDD